MITWLDLWLILPMPSFILTVLASMPTMFRGYGGGMVREFYLNYFVLPIIETHDAIVFWIARLFNTSTTNHAAQLVAWFESATPVQEWFLAVGAAITFNALLLPVLFIFIVFRIELSAWWVRTNMEQKSRAIK